MENFQKKLLHEKDKYLHKRKGIENTSKREDEKISQPDKMIKPYLKRFYDDLVVKEENISRSCSDVQVEVMINEDKRDELDRTEINKYKHIKETEETETNSIFLEKLEREQVAYLNKDRKTTLDKWLDYFTSPDSSVYLMWSKYMAFFNMLKFSNYDK